MMCELLLRSSVSVAGFSFRQLRKSLVNNHQPLTRETLEMSIEPIYDPSKDYWHRWPSIWSLSCLLVKVYLAALIASFVVAMPSVLAWTAFITLYQMLHR